MKISKQRKALVISFLLILVSLITFTATTFAWFSDSVSSNNNIITVGNLDAEMYWADDLSDTWHNIEDEKYNTVFKHNNYEPGYTTVKYLKIVNTGALAFKYDLSLLATGTVGKLAEVVDLYYLSNVSSKVSLETMNKTGVVKDVLGKSLNNADALLPKGKSNGIDNSHEVVVAIALHMQEDAGNIYKGESLGTFTIQLTATQYSFEEDSFGSNYDKEASFPVNVSTSVSTSNGLVTEEATMGTDLASAVIPAGVSVNEGTNTLTLSVTEMSQTQSNVVVSSDEKATSLDVHVSGISKDNTKPVLVTINTVSQKYLNKGNISLYHVENGVTVTMTQVNSLAELDAHNEFYYDSKTGTFTVALASFSEIRMVEKTINAWQGDADFSWYLEPNVKVLDTDPDYVIYNADQLWALSQLVGGMSVENDYECVTFAGKTIKLIADINLGDDEANNNEDIVFYPIGYYNDVKSYNRDGQNLKVTNSSVTTFAGTFDGAGHTVANFYQNTWEMYGDYRDGYGASANYYKDAMGLFGYVNGGTVKNLTVKNFSSDGEFTPTGVVAAFAAKATFDNISIKNCNPRVYNTGNGGIIGIAGNSTDNNDDKNLAPTKADDTFIKLSNITVDNSNKISALWGSWDVACGGLVGMYRGAGGIFFDDCHVSAQIDVNNDVCANYQYYAYRYAGMIIGSVRKNETINGVVYPRMAGIFADSCTVHYSTWNDYYYCELEANSLASYSEDYQFSRLEKIESLADIQDENGNWIRTGNFIIVAENKCYHIVNDNGTLKEHEHTAEENNQRVYLPFGQLITGYSWGVTSKDIGEVSGVTEMDPILVGSIDKFDVLEIVNTKYKAGTTIKLSDLFKASEKSLEDSMYNIRENNIEVGITYYTYVDSVKYTQNVDVTVVKLYEEDGETLAPWTTWYFELPTDAYGEVTVTIQDYVYCNQTTVELHVHEYSDTYQKDSDGHWKVCTTCGEATAKVEHKYNSRVVKESTCTSTGWERFTCQDCGHFYDEVINKKPHNYNYEYVDNVHYNVCTSCAEEVNHSAHTYTGTSTTCSVCSYTYSKEITVDTNKLYFIPNDNWKQANARFAAYFFNDSTGKNTWVSLTATGVADLYEVTIPDGYYKVIFCRMNPNTTANNWTKDTVFWNQTSNLDIPTNDNNCYTVKDGTWDNGGGTWSEHKYQIKAEFYSYPPNYSADKIYLKPTSIWNNSNARFAAYFFNSNTDNIWVDMTDVNNDGIFECVIPSGYSKLIFCRMNGSTTANNWNNKWNQTEDLYLYNDQKQNIMYTITNIGSNGANSSGNWSNDETSGTQILSFGSYYFQECSTKETVELTLYFDPNTSYSFKIHNMLTNGWYGNNGLINDNASDLILGTGTPNCKFVPTGGYYKFTFNIVTNKLTITYLGTSLN